MRDTLKNLHLFQHVSRSLERPVDQLSLLRNHLSVQISLIRTARNSFYTSACRYIRRSLLILSLGESDKSADVIACHVEFINSPHWEIRLIDLIAFNPAVSFLLCLSLFRLPVHNSSKSTAFAESASS